MIISAAVVGMTGAFADKLLAGSIVKDGSVVLAGPGEPLGGFYRGICGDRDRDFNLRQDKAGYSPYSSGMYRNGDGRRAVFRTAYIEIYDVAWFL